MFDATNGSDPPFLIWDLLMTNGLETKKFQMAPPDEKQSGMYNIKLRQDEEVVESLLDIDNRQ